MPSQKNQHYVPKFYLKNFSRDKKNLNIYLINGKKFISGPIKHQCSKSYFYSKGVFENLLSKLESREASAINNLLREKTLTKLDYKEDYIRILEFISIMYGRTFTKKKEMEKVIEDFVEKIFKPMFRADPLSKDLSDKDIASITMEWPYLNLLSVQIGLKGGVLLLDLMPVLLINNTPLEFWISDHPTVFYNQTFYHLNGVSMCGYTSYGLQIFCPISPTICLMLFHSPYYEIKMSRSHEVILSIEDVKEINKLQFFTGFNSIFYKNESQKSYIEQAHKELGEIPEKPYVSSKFEKFVSNTGEIKDMFHLSHDKIPYKINLNFIKPIKIGAGSIGNIRNLQLYNVFKKI